jgi:uncharacterized Rmd1/YagE family protein
MAQRRLAARAVLLAERLDHRGLVRLRAGVANPLPLPAPPGVAAFAFRWGAVALFDGTAEEQGRILDSVRPRLGDILPEPVEEAAALLLDPAEDGPDAAGVIHLRDGSPARLAVVAEALAKSAALAHQEAALARTLDRIEPVVATLRRHGRLGASSRALLRAVGEALAARSRAAARVQTEAKPELLWHHPELESLYARLSEELELAERSAALERRLAMIHEGSDTLLSLIETRRSRVLEAAVVALIAIEVGTTLYGLFTP